jgi:thioredoxin 1
MKSVSIKAIFFLIFLTFGHNNLSAQNNIAEHYDSLSVDEYLKLTKGNKPVLIYFKADWCVPCVKMEPIIGHLKEARKDIAIITLDVDNNPKISLHLEINTLPLFIFYRKGEKAWENNSYMSAEELKLKIDSSK